MLGYMHVLVREATTNDTDAVLRILDEFNDFVYLVFNPELVAESTFSRENSSQMFAEVVTSDRSLFLIAIVKEQIVGFLEMHMVPRVRKANYYAELETLYVNESYRGKGVATQLVQKAADWATSRSLDAIRVYSIHQLTESHAFYENVGFIHSGKTYRLPIN